MSPPTLAVELRQYLHSRVHNTFLPLSIRHNRVEDIFLDFLTWLVATGSEERDSLHLTADRTADFVMERLADQPDRFRLTENLGKRELIHRWIRADLVVEPRQSNRTSDNTVSIVPLHTSVANYFEPPNSTPGYGRFICELLSRRGDETSLDLLQELNEVLSSSGNDLVALVLEEALATDDESHVGDPKFRTFLGWEEPRMVWSESHAAAFQRQVSSVLSFQTVLSRRTFVAWLYSIITYFLATYFLRTATAAEAYAKWLVQAFEGNNSRWTKSVDDIEFSPRIPYGCRDETHATLLKRFPGNTSLINIAQGYADLVGFPIGRNQNLTTIGDTILEAIRESDSTAVFGELATTYPTKDLGRPWNLPDEDKQRLLDVSALNPFVLAAQLLNFEDMARRSNNVMEWQFYSSLAKHQSYGFAGRGRTGAIMAYRMSEPLLVALSHCHLEQSRGDATLGSLLDYLSELGFVFDADGRSQLERELLGVGMLEDLSDASDAKFLTPLYAIQEVEG